MQFVNYIFIEMKLKKLISGMALFVFILTVSSCGRVNKAEKETVAEEALSMEVSIGGMTCLACEQTIQRKVGKLEGIKSVTASFTIGNAIIEYVPGKADTLKIKEAITGSGYTVKKIIAPVSE
jgi:copper chaperone CopZ